MAKRLDTDAEVIAWAASKIGPSSGTLIDFKLRVIDGDRLDLIGDVITRLPIGDPYRAANRIMWRNVPCTTADARAFADLVKIFGPRWLSATWRSRVSES